MAPHWAIDLRTSNTTVCVDVGQPRTPTETGLLCFRGPNVFGGYLGEPERTKEVLPGDGWFHTGDLGRFDEDGFLFIEGRLTRFSKIGGEMVPHGTVEQAVARKLGLVQFGADVHVR